MFWFFWPQGLWDLSSPTRDRTCTPYIGRRSLNHWTAREASFKIFIRDNNDLKMSVKSRLEGVRVLKEELIFIDSIIPKLLCYLLPLCLMEGTYCLCGE